MISVVIPAHNEIGVIESGLQKLVMGVVPGELEVIVVCNGCTDKTAEAASSVGEPVRVLESAEPSKSQAINLGMRNARGDVIVVVDADIRIGISCLRALDTALKNDGVMAAAPAVQMEYLDQTAWSVRAYYRFWMELPYVKEGMMAAGVYAMNRQGHNRLGEFPRIIADDGYFRLLFTDQERSEVSDAVSYVLAPLSMRDLIRIKTRSRLGWYELRNRFPDLFTRELKSRGYLRGILTVLRRLRSWPGVVPYVYVNAISRIRAKRQLRTIGEYVWERDEGSRQRCAPSPTDSDAKASV